MRLRLPDIFNPRGEETWALSVDARVPQDGDAISLFDLPGLFQPEIVTAEEIAWMVLCEEDLVAV